MKKVALICAIVLLIGIIPAFALNQTSNNTTGVQVQNQSVTSDQTCTAQNQQTQYGQGNCDSCSENCGTGTCDGICNGGQYRYRYGQVNGHPDPENCGEHQNCPKS